MGSIRSQSLGDGEFPSSKNGFLTSPVNRGNDLAPMSRMVAELSAAGLGGNPGPFFRYITAWKDTGSGCTSRRVPPDESKKPASRSDRGGAAIQGGSGSAPPLRGRRGN